MSSLVEDKRDIRRRLTNLVVTVGAFMGVGGETLMREGGQFSLSERGQIRLSLDKSVRCMMPQYHRGTT